MRSIVRASDSRMMPASAGITRDSLHYSLFFFIVSVLNNEALYETYYEEVIEEAKLSDTLHKFSKQDLHLAVMNKFYGYQ